MFVIATDSFYRTQNDTVFSVSKSENIKRSAEDFNPNKHTRNLVHFFSDNKEISLNLSDESIKLLESHFEEDDFLRLSNGHIGLSGKAAAFVDGWYKDIMINRDFLNADRDKNGKIENNEYLSLKNSVKDEEDNQIVEDEGWISLRMAKRSTGYAESEISDKRLSVEDILNESIKSDRNFDGAITRLEYSARGGTDMQGYTNWALDTLSDIYSDILGYDKEKKKTTLVIDPYDEISSLWDGVSADAMRDFYEGRGLSFSTPQMSGTIVQGTESLGDEFNKEELLKEQLFNEFPEFRALIQNNPTITKEQLLKLRKHQRIAQNYQHNQKEDLQKEFTQNFFKTDIKA